MNKKSKILLIIMFMLITIAISYTAYLDYQESKYEGDDIVSCMDYS